MTKELLHELFYYKDGKLFNKKGRRGVTKDAIAGNITKDGYMAIMIKGKTHKAHKLVWFYHNGDIPEGLEIDHINRIRNDNNIDNLRLVTRQQNNWNTSGKGCYWREGKKKWQSYIGLNGKRKYLGSFDNETDARNAYLEAKTNLHFI